MRSLLLAGLRVVLAVALTVAALVVPFSIAVSDSAFDARASAGMAAAVGLLFGFGGGRGAGAWLGAVSAFVVGIGAALATGLIPGRGMFLLLPPVHALAVGFVWGARSDVVRTAGDAARLCLGCGLFLGIGILYAQGWFGLSSAIGNAAGALTYVEALRLVEARRRGEPLRFAPLSVAALMSAAIVWLAVGRVMNEIGGLTVSLTALGAVVMLLVVPVVICVAARGVARWLVPRAALLRALGEYVRALSLPIGAFAIGYLVIVVAFAGAFGAVFRGDPESFRFAIDPGGDPGIGTWLFTAFVVATSQTLVDVTPVSGLARLLVGVELLLCLGWAVVVFAAVMAHAGPVLQKIAERNQS